MQMKIALEQEPVTPIKALYSDRPKSRQSSIPAPVMPFSATALGRIEPVPIVGPASAMAKPYASHGSRNKAFASRGMLGTASAA
jgi:hypothetical protein